MAMIRYNGMQDVMPTTFSSMLDRFFNESVNSSRVAGFTPHVDACETEKGYEIEVALPGVRKEDISIDFQEGKLSITGERKFERKEENRRYHMQETQFGSFSRIFYLPDKVNPDQISAEFEDGILLVHVPKDEQKTMKRQINITSSSNGKKKVTEGKSEDNTEKAKAKK